jgi:hypothetical protein
VLSPQRSMRELGIAGTKDHVGLEVDAQLLLHRLLGFDRRQHPEALGLERFDGACDGLIK